MVRKVAGIRKQKYSRREFDPFEDRVSRDIRNTLSDAFVKSLAILNPSLVEEKARAWLTGNLESFYTGYIRDRQLKYRRVFAQIRQHGINDSLQQVIILWNEALFFELHDHLEDVWTGESGGRRHALQGLIKAAGVYIHLEYNRRNAAEKLAFKAREIIKQYSHEVGFIANLQDLVDRLGDIDLNPPILEVVVDPDID